MNSGTLHVVATPLGNLADLTERAKIILCDVSVVAAEDTRRSRILLDHIGANPRVLSFHSHSGDGRLQEILNFLAAGTDVALVSDAGTPTVSDPGRSLVFEARARGVVVTAIPGPSAVIAAVSVSGLAGDRFTFLGFLPRRGSERRRLVDGIAENPWTVVLYEAANRLVRTLEELAERCGAEREAVVARELTKLHEDIRSGTLSKLTGYYRDNPPRGEVTLVIAGQKPATRHFDEAEARQRGQALLDSGQTGRDAATRLAGEMGISRNEAYKVINSL